MLPDRVRDEGRESMGYLLAAVGGAVGALARWAVSEALPADTGAWPWATLVVNLAGCLLLGVLLAVLGRRSPDPAWARPLLGTGVLGGFTTYSTFAVDVVDLTETGRAVVAAGYVAASVLGGVCAVWLGTRLVRRTLGAPVTRVGEGPA